jgi:hypothetical protein
MPKHQSNWMTYGHAVRAHEVAMSLHWISILEHDLATGLYRVSYVAKLDQPHR